MRTRIAITEKVLVDGRWYFHNQVFPFVEVTGDIEKSYKIKTDSGFVIIPGAYCVEIPDTLTLDSRSAFQMMEETMDKTPDYQKAYKEVLGIKEPKMLSAETGKPITEDTPIQTDGRQKNIPRAGEAGDI